MADIHPAPDASMMAPAAGMEIQAPMEDLAGLAEAAMAAANARQPEALAILESPPGAGAMNVLAGFADYESTGIAPGASLETPVQGAGDYPGTTQDGVQKYGTS